MADKGNTGGKGGKIGPSKDTRKSTKPGAANDIRKDGKIGPSKDTRKAK